MAFNPKWCVLILLLMSQMGFSQVSFSGKVISASDSSAVPKAQISLQNGKTFVTDEKGAFEIKGLTKNKDYTFTVFKMNYDFVEKTLSFNQDTDFTFKLPPLSEQLSEVVLTRKREKLFAHQRLKDVEGTAIYAGKKTEVVNMKKVTGNLATNNARQIYSQIVGLNIYENSAGGLQLNIGGRGLNPNRTKNFNTRQNGYDIAADVLGYPESYYTPPPEALERVQVVRGAASLQYGTQFGGLINFITKKPNPDKKFELTSRQTLGSNNLFTSFNSVSGTVGDISYYGYYNYKNGDGFRPNSDFESNTAFMHLGWQAAENTKLEFEYTYFDYLAQQPGGLTDKQFYDDPDFSNRARNYFDVNWNLFSAKWKQQLSDRTKFKLTVYGLDATRKNVGFRDNRVSSVDPGGPRELIVGDFENYAAEARLLSEYNLGGNTSYFLVGSKYYNSSNGQKQGPGSDGSDADFSFAEKQFPNYTRQSDFDFPNENLAFFGENLFQITDKFSLTPGVRFEHITTESKGNYRNIILDLAGNPLVNEQLSDNRKFNRNFVLFGLGSSYKFGKNAELYANFSQNYRSVTFNDIRVTNPVFQVDPDITDEEGFTADLGLRGRVDNNLLTYDVNVFGLRYKKRIGETLKPEERLNADGEMEETGRIIRFRGNIGDSFVYGLETFGNLNLRKIIAKNATDYKANLFLNASFTDSEYTDSDQNNVEGNEVEFIPKVNLKTGLNFGYKNFLGSVQYTYLSKQYTDATNAPQDKMESQRGIEGAIPAYGILDLSFSYSYKFLKLETGINNILDNDYFTRRATGYPGPGIIPAKPLSWYTTLQVKL